MGILSPLQFFKREPLEVTTYHPRTEVSRFYEKSDPRSSEQRLADQADFDKRGLPRGA